MKNRSLSCHSDCGQQEPRRWRYWIHSTMVKFTLSVVVVIFWTTSHRDASGAIVLSEEAAIFFSSGAVNLDMALMTDRFNDVEFGQMSVSETSFAGSTWTSTTTGEYLGTQFALTYVGDVSNLDSGIISWTVNGNFGSDVWQGSGQAVMSAIDTPNFSLNINTQQTIGTETVTASGMGIGTNTIDELSARSSMIFSNRRGFNVRWRNFVGRRSPRRSNGGVTREPPSPVIDRDSQVTIRNQGWVIRISVQSIPEPSSAGLVSVSCAVVAFRRNRLRHSRRQLG